MANPKACNLYVAFAMALVTAVDGAADWPQSRHIGAWLAHWSSSMPADI
jgi:hypothetical protein